MPRNPTRRAIVAHAVKARRPALSGGTTAPRSAAGGPRTGLGQARPAPRPKLGLGQNRPAAAPIASGPGASPAPAGPAPTPWDSRYEQTVSGANRSYLNANVNFDLAEQGAKQDFGLDPGFNDYQSNPYSRAALLQQSYLNANRGTMNSAGLQLYSGSTSNRLSANRSANAQGRDQLAKAYRDALGEISTGRAKAAEAKAEATQQAYWDRIEAAEGSEPEAAAAPEAGGGQRKRKRKHPHQPAVGRGRKAR